MPIGASLKALVTLDEAAAYLSMVAANMSQEQQDSLQERINAVSEAMEKYCCTPLVKTAATEYYDGGSARIQLRRSPVDVAASFVVKENGAAIAIAKDGTYTTADGGTIGFWYLPDGNVIERNGTWLSGRRVIEVTYTAGMVRQVTAGTATRTDKGQTLDAVEGPKDLSEACLIIVKAHQDYGPTNWGAEMVGDRVMRPAAWPLSARLILDKYVYWGAK